MEDDDEEEEDIETVLQQNEKNKYLNQDNKHKSDEILGKRVKRQSDYEYTPTKTRCPLLLVADYRFFQEMGASNTKTTISYLVCIMYFLHFFSFAVYHVCSMYILEALRVD